MPVPHAMRMRDAASAGDCSEATSIIYQFEDIQAGYPPEDITDCGVIVWETGEGVSDRDHGLGRHE